ncbi:MAG: GNAT family N-acetyltransferase [Maritimibacter sp.]
MASVTLRLAAPSDARGLAQLMHGAIHAISDCDYTKAQRDAWSPAPMPAANMAGRLTDGRTVWVAETAEPTDPLGFIELEATGHIDCFYLTPSAQGTGVATLLFAALEAQARARGLGTLTVDASTVAKRFFLKRGFLVIEKQTLKRAGITLHNFKMQKTLP